MIHRLRREDPTGTSQLETVQMDEAVAAAFHALSQQLDERLTMLESNQANALAHLRQETVALPAEVALHERDTGKLKQTHPFRRIVHSSKGPTKALSDTPKREIDDSIWPLLNRGMSVRAIAEKANTSTATVGRSRKRWESANRNMTVSQ